MDENWAFVVENHSTPETVYDNHSEIVEALQTGLRVIRTSGDFPVRLQTRVLAEAVYSALLEHYNK